MTPRWWRAGSAGRRARAALAPDLRDPLVRALYDNLLPIGIMVLALAPLGGWVVWASPEIVLEALFGLALAAAVARLAIVLALRPRRDQPLTRSGILVRERVFAAGSLAFSAALGTFGARTAAVGTPMDLLVVMALMSGYGAGIVARVSSCPRIAVPSLVLTLLPLALALLLRGSLPDIMVATAILMFGIGGLQAIAYVHGVLLDHLRMRRHLASLARNDALTGLANRLHLEERLSGELARLRRQGGIAALHYCDLDGFKGVNDRFGHRSGDLLLKEVAERLAGLLRGGDLAARIGGDEFVVLQVGCAHPDEAELLARRIGRAVAVPFRIEGRDIEIATSVGVAIAPADGASPEAWLEAADGALYRAKARGRNRVVMAADGAAA